MSNKITSKIVKINLTKGTIDLPKKALSKLKKTVKPFTKNGNGTTVLNEGESYHKVKNKEYYYRDVYISGDYMIVPLKQDIFKLMKNIEKKDECTNDAMDEIVEHTVESYNTEREEISKQVDEMFDHYRNKMQAKREEEELRNDFMNKVGIKAVPYGEDTENPLMFFGMMFKEGSRVLNSEIPENGYFMYKGELYFKIKQGRQLCARRLPDLTPMSQIVPPELKYKIKDEEVLELFLIEK